MAQYRMSRRQPLIFSLYEFFLFCELVYNCTETAILKFLGTIENEILAKFILHFVNLFMLCSAIGLSVRSSVCILSPHHDKPTCKIFVRTVYSFYGQTYFT